MKADTPSDSFIIGAVRQGETESTVCKLGNRLYFESVTTLGRSLYFIPPGTLIRRVCASSKKACSPLVGHNQQFFW